MHKYSGGRHLVSTFFAGFFCVLPISNVTFAGQSQDMAAAVQADTKRCVNASYKQDVKTALECTHPKVVTMMGGREAAESQLTAAFRQIKMSEMRLEALSFPKPPAFFNGVKNRYVFVPTLSIISRNGQKVESTNFQLGWLDPQSQRWRFLDGSRINPANVGLFFDDFPPGIAFPPYHQKRL